MSNMVRAISKNGGAIVCAVDSTNIVSKMESIHKTSATASAALGRLLTGAALIGSSLENKEDSVTLKLKGGGIIGTVTAICGFGGNVRGCCDCPQADLPLNPANSKLNVGALVGTGGCLTVIKDIGLNEPYIGQTPLVSGEVAEDITSYFAKSEQIPTACALGVLVNPDLTIKAAGGYMLQLLPGASEEEILLIE
ncbi:MAG: Hsp33 family molecular chaperone HslO, partial [Oscillospiraceae bacterium]